MQGAPWPVRFNFNGVNTGVRNLKFRVHAGSYYIVDTT